MQIEKDAVVSFRYQLFEGETLLEDSLEEGQAVLYLHGHNGMLPALQESLEGHQAGDDVEVTLPPEKAYGPRREAALERVPVKHLLTKGRIKPGSVVQVNTQQGPREVVVIKVGKFNVDVDTNHPLSGKTLRFAMKIDAVRPATSEELRHGHAHGAGGHQH